MLSQDKPRHPLTTRLDTLIIAYSIHLITALLALPMLIWHISSTHIIDDYGMPDHWVEAFYKTQFDGGRRALWGFLFAVVTIDCIHALLALDYYHGRRYARGAISHHRDRHSTPAHPPRTYHPFLTPRFPAALQHTLLTLYDLTLASFLFLHITFFFLLLDTNWDACDAYVPMYPANYEDPKRTNMSVVERCQRINTDMYVSGGFNVSLCVGLLGVHAWHVGFRVWEWCVCRDKEGEKEGAEMGGDMDGGSEERKRIGQREGGQSTTIRYRDWSAQGRWRRSTRGGSVAPRDRSSSVESARWSEVLLECLVP